MHKAASAYKHRSALTPEQTE